MTCWLEFWLVLILGLTINPLLMILVLILVLCLFVVNLSLWMGSFFFSFLVFLLFMSGLIMMLMYFCSIILNEKVFLLADFFFIWVLMVLTSVGAPGTAMLDKSSDLPGKMFYSEFYNLVKFMWYPYSVYSVFFISYLLFCLVVIYCVVKKCSGPLRMKI